MNDGRELVVYSPAPIKYDGGFLFAVDGCVNPELKGKMFEIHFVKTKRQAASGAMENVLELKKAYGIFEGKCASCSAYNTAESSIVLVKNNKEYEFYADRSRNNFEFAFLDDYPDTIDKDLKDRTVRVYYVYEEGMVGGQQHSKYRIIKMIKL